MSFDQDQRRKTYRLNLRPFRGLVVSVRKPGFDALEALTRAVLVLGDDFDGLDLSPTYRMSAWSELFSAFADSLLAWNLTDCGRAVPATRDGVRAQDLEFLLALCRTWHAAVVLAPMNQGDELEAGDQPDTPIAEPELDEEYLAQLGAKAVVLPAPELDLAGVT
jgi:hypothetical protein